MELIWYGHSFFEIREKTSQGKVSLATNPFSEKIGLEPPKKVEADILVVSSKNCDYLNKKIIAGNPFIIEEPGEYEIKEARIKGIPCGNEEKEKGPDTIFIINIGGIKICHMGNFNESELSPNQLENIFGVDILLIPVGGDSTVSGKEAAKIVSRIEPKIVIPMRYKIPGVKLDMEDEKPFLGAMGIEDKEKIKKLKIKKNEAQKDGTEVILLERV